MYKCNTYSSVFHRNSLIYKYKTVADIYSHSELQQPGKFKTSPPKFRMRVDDDLSPRLN